jgi:hypothetical protein
MEHQIVVVEVPSAPLRVPPEVPPVVEMFHMNFFILMEPPAGLEPGTC